MSIPCHAIYLDLDGERREDDEIDLSHFSKYGLQKFFNDSITYKGWEVIDFREARHTSVQVAAFIAVEKTEVASNIFTENFITGTLVGE